MFYLPVDVRWNDAPHNLFINSFNTNWLNTQSDGVTPKYPISNPFPGGHYSAVWQEPGLD